WRSGSTCGRGSIECPRRTSRPPGGRRRWAPSGWSAPSRRDPLSTIAGIIEAVFLRENEVGARVAAHLTAGQRVLDYGAGTGLVARWLASAAEVEPTLAD